ncbi:MAG: ATP-binding protein [Syntrophomonas sp.]
MATTLNHTEASPFFPPLEPGCQLIAEYPCICDYDFYQTGDPDREAGCGGTYYKRIYYGHNDWVHSERTSCKCMIEWEEKHQAKMEAEKKIADSRAIAIDINTHFKPWNMLDDDAFSDMRFEKYKPEDPSQIRAFSLLKNFTTDRGGVCLCGRPGRGKTHLAVSCARKLRMQGFSVLAIRSVDLLNKLRRCYSSKDENAETSILRVLKKADVLVIDDIGTENPTGWVKTTLYDIIDYRKGRAATIFTTHLEGETMEKKLDPGLTSRIYGAGVELRLAGRDYRIKDDEEWLKVGKEIDLGDREV